MVATVACQPRSRIPHLSRAVVFALTVAFGVSLVAAALVPAAADRAGTSWMFTPRAEAEADGLDPAITGAGIHRTIVRSEPGAFEAAKAAVTTAGGQISTDIPFVDSFTASLTTEQARAAIEAGAVMSITLDRKVQFEEMTYDDATTASSFARTVGATEAWKNGNLGSGVGVAVIDTGVSPMNDFEGRIVHGPDLSGEGTIVDSYGHGTVMAGIVAGSGADSATNTGGAYTGVAPKTHVVAVKVAGQNGAVDVSTMLQAMHWVAAYQSQFNIRVLNLSWGVASTQDPSKDPLNYAVQRLWNSGIVVVVAAGNSGPNSGTIRKPADDPLVISVGAFDDKQNLDPADDAISSWSSRGPTAQGLTKPDIIAPGRLIVSARSFGSRIEAENPRALIAPSYIRGSGTSQAAAVTSGAIALLLAARPDLTPDQVKAIVKGTASPISGKTGNDQGSGRFQLGAALAAPEGAAQWQTSSATGLGSIDASRGGRHVETDCNGDGMADVIKGEIDVRCAPWNGAAWNGAAWTGAAWTGAAWTGDTWTGAAWTGAAWTGAAWTGAAWTGAAWTGGTWNGAAWTGAAWTGDDFSGAAWTGAAWTGAAWTGAAWTGAAWTGNDFTTAEYEEEIFLTAWYGMRPPPWMSLPGEPVYPGSLYQRTA